MKWPAKFLAQLPQADLQHGVQTNVRHVGKFPRDFNDIAEARQIARGDARAVRAL